MKRLSLLVSLVFVFCFVFISASTMAQDAAATADPGPVVINVEQPAGSAETNVFSTSNIISFLVGSIVSAIGILVTLGGAARQVLNDPAKIILAEKLGDSIPGDHAKGLLEALADIRALIKEATDHTPAYSKTPSEKSALYDLGGPSILS